MLHLNPNTEKKHVFFQAFLVMRYCHAIFLPQRNSWWPILQQVTSVPLLRFYRYTFAVQVGESRILIWVSKHFSVNIVVVWGDTGPIVWAPFSRITVCHCKDPKGPDNMMGEFCTAWLKTRMSSLHRSSTRSLGKDTSPFRVTWLAGKSPCLIEDISSNSCFAMFMLVFRGVFLTHRIHVWIIYLH